MPIIAVALLMGSLAVREVAFLAASHHHKANAVAVAQASK